MEANSPSNSRQRRRLRRALAACGRVERRLLFNESMRQLTRQLPVVLAAAIALELSVRRQWVSEDSVASLRWLALLPLVLAVFRVLLPRALTGRSMLLLDRHHRLEGRLSNALIFSQSSAESPSAWEHLAIADGLRAVPSLKPADAIALAVPRAIGYSLGLGVLWAGVWFWPAPKAEPGAAESKASHAEVLAAEDVQVLREGVDSLAEQPLTAPAAEALREYRELLEGVSKQNMSRQEVFRKLGELEGQMGSVAFDEGELASALRVAGNALRGRGVAKPLADALRQNDWERAARALHKIAEGLDRRDRQATAERVALGRALRKASEHAQRRSKRLRARRKRLLQQRERLLKRKRDTARAPSTAGQEPNNKRQLRRLGQREAELEEAARTLSQLDRQLAEVARQLLEQLGRRQESVQEMARRLEAVNQRRLTEEQKRALKAQLEQMRRLLQESAAGGAERRRRLAQLEARAKGRQSGAMPPASGGSEPGGAMAIPIPVPQVGEADSPRRPSAARASGSGHSGQVAGEPPEGESSRGLPAAKKDARAVALDTGEGLASTEVVYGAAARGFASQSYERIYRDYETVAEEVLSRDQIPPGYEHSVRRYFQLIRPRTQR